MWKNHLKVALRTLWRHRGFTAINVFGLGLGLAVCLLLVLFVRDQRSYDAFHAGADDNSSGVAAMLELARLVAEGLEEAHRRGVLHRDIKPDNILVRHDEDGWWAKIIDFGLALKDAAPQATVTKTEAISGPFGSTIATRSPRPIPRAFNASTVRPTSSRSAP